jgi:hypothetical protein
MQLRLQHRRTKNYDLPVAALLQPMAGKIKKDAEYAILRNIKNGQRIIITGTLLFSLWIFVGWGLIVRTLFPFKSFSSTFRWAQGSHGRRHATHATYPFHVMSRGSAS